jgi:hypothetical protein
MKKSIFKFALPVAIAAFMVVSCKKNKCEECHYDVNGTEVEMGKLCGDDLEDKEKNGIMVDGVKYDVHCHEH